MAPYGPTLLRLAPGLVFVAHGAQKLFGLGGGGLTATAQLFAQIGLSPAFVLAMLAGLVEIFGGLLILAGLFTRTAAGVFAVGTLAAVWKVHLAHGFFLRSNAAGPGHGYEVEVVLIAALASLMLTGPGALSIDRATARDAETEAAGRARLRSGAV